MKVSAQEELLIASCLKKEPEAIRTFSALYGRPIYGFLKSALGIRAELTHSILIRAMSEYLRTTTAFELKEHILVTLMRSLLRDISRELKRKDSTGSLKEKDPRLTILFESLALLKWQERVLVLLRDQMDFDYEEIASILSLKLEEVKSRIKTARVHFRENIDQLLFKQKSSHREL